jgi:hypothetical protein
MLLIAGIVFGVSGELIVTAKINYFMLACLLIMGVLVLWKNKYLALIISVLLGLVSMYFILALFSEFREFPAGSKEGMNMLITGLLIFGSLIILSVMMPIKYFNRKDPVN